MGSAQVVEALLHSVVQRRVRQGQGDVLVPQPLVQLLDLHMRRQRFVSLYILTSWIAQNSALGGISAKYMS